MTSRAPARDDPLTPIHLRVVCAHPGPSQYQRYARRAHYEKDHLLLVVARDENLDGSSRPVDLLQGNARECAGMYQLG